MYLREWRLKLSHFFPAAVIMALAAMHAQPGLAGSSGDVYVLTNQATGNSIMVFERDAAGALTYLATYASGGNGAGTGADPLGSQNSLVLSPDRMLLFAVNAGSNSVSVFAVLGNHLKLLNTASSGGIMPVSVAVAQGYVYVVNAGGTPNISGFLVHKQTGQLIPLEGSTQNLPGGAAASPAQISFRPDGGALVVTEKGTNLIDTFVLKDWIAQPGVSYLASGTEPFGFAFGRNDVAVVSDASGGAAGAAAVASYAVAKGGDVEIITPALGDTQSGACWLAITPDGKVAYTTNTASGTISSYAVSADGTLALLNAAAGTPGNITPIDMAMSAGGNFLYVRDAGNGGISAYSVASDGSLTPLAGASGIPSGAQGIAAR
ncbi:MAG: lactonase family protein [Bryobacteraceae bacterium]